MRLIPDLKTTQEALAFGISEYGNKEVIRIIETEIEVREKFMQLLLLNPELTNDMLRQIHKIQMRREALETMTGKLPVTHLQFTYNEVYQEGF